MSIKTDFLSLVKSQVNRGIYVRGGNGEDLTDMPDPKAWIERREKPDETHTKAQNAARAIRLYDKRLDSGVNPVLAFDCSGLMYWAGKQVGIFKSDLTANGIYGKCRKITRSELQAGDFVFKHNGKRATHVGVCVGEKFVDCRGRDVGVIESKFSASVWNAYGRLDAMQDDEPEAYIFTRDLKYGCTGEDVIELKRLLIDHGFGKGITVDKVSSKRFGSTTRKRVKEYQKSAGLKVDGIAGHDTIITLGGIWCG